MYLPSRITVKTNGERWLQSRFCRGIDPKRINGRAYRISHTRNIWMNVAFCGHAIDLLAITVHSISGNNNHNVQVKSNRVGNDIVLGTSSRCFHTFRRRIDPTPVILICACYNCTGISNIWVGCWMATTYAQIRTCKGKKSAQRYSNSDSPPIWSCFFPQYTVT